MKTERSDSTGFFNVLQKATPKAGYTKLTIKTHRLITGVDASTKRTSTKVGRPAMVRVLTVVLEKERMDLVEF